jgi:hypothetical protein
VDDNDGGGAGRIESRVVDIGVERVVECVFWWLVDGIFGLGILELRPRDS